MTNGSAAQATQGNPGKTRLTQLPARAAPRTANRAFLSRGGTAGHRPRRRGRIARLSRSVAAPTGQSRKQKKFPKTAIAAAIAAAGRKKAFPAPVAMTVAAAR